MEIPINYLSMNLINFTLNYFHQVLYALAWILLLLKRYSSIVLFNNYWHCVLHWIPRLIKLQFKIIFYWSIFWKTTYSWVLQRSPHPWIFQSETALWLRWRACVCERESKEKTRIKWLNTIGYGHTYIILLWIKNNDPNRKSRN